MRDVFVATLMEIAAHDPRVMLITADLGFGVLTKFQEKLPAQFLNVGVAEQNMTGIATGMALEGHVVFTYSIANFPTLRCLEQLRNDAAYHNANVKVVAIGGGFSYGALGMSHHATEDLAILRSMPNVTVLSPGDDFEVAEATAALINVPGTAYLRLDKSTAGDTRDSNPNFEIGRARMLMDGEDLTLISTGGILKEVLLAATQLQAAGYTIRVLSAHTIKPFDQSAVIAAATETGGVITVEEHVREGGLGSAVAEVCLDAGVSPERFTRLAVSDGFSGIVGSQEYLRSRIGLDAEAIVATAQRLLAPVAPRLRVQRGS